MLFKASSHTTFTRPHRNSGPRSGTSPFQPAHKKQTPLGFIFKPKTFTIPDQQRQVLTKLLSLLEKKYFKGGGLDYVQAARV